MTGLHQKGKEKHNEGLEGSEKHGDQKKFQGASEYKDAGKGSKPYRKTCRAVINSIPHAQAMNPARIGRVWGKAALRAGRTRLFFTLITFCFLGFYKVHDYSSIMVQEFFGRVIVKEEPFPSWLSTSICPSVISSILFTKASPRPFPSVLWEVSP